MNRELKEGESYLFTIEKYVTLPDGERRLRFRCENGRAVLFDGSTYTLYNLEPGVKVRCRVDKINCRGELFLEPEHPVYREGEWHRFTVKFVREIEGSRIRKGRVLVVTGALGEEIVLPVPHGYDISAAGDSINLYVARIKKGRVYLSVSDDEPDASHPDGGGRYHFKVTGTEVDYDGEEYFVVEDQHGVTHAMVKRYYEHYGLSSGKSFRGTVVKYRADGSTIIEPDNPFYRVGEKINIHITKLEVNSADGSWYLVGRDLHGFYHELRSDVEPHGDMVECYVEMIRKGKPLLRPLL